MFLFLFLCVLSLSPAFAALRSFTVAFNIGKGDIIEDKNLVLSKRENICTVYTVAVKPNPDPHDFKLTGFKETLASENMVILPILKIEVDCTAGKYSVSPLALKPSSKEWESIANWYKGMQLAAKQKTKEIEEAKAIQEIQESIVKIDNGDQMWPGEAWPASELGIPVNPVKPSSDDGSTVKGASQKRRTRGRELVRKHRKQYN